MLAEREEKQVEMVLDVHKKWARIDRWRARRYWFYRIFRLLPHLEAEQRAFFIDEYTGK